MPPKLRPTGLTLALLPEPDHAVRHDLPARLLRCTDGGHLDHRYASTGTSRPRPHVLPTWAAVDLRQADAIVLGVSVVLFFGAMVVFGRLAGQLRRGALSVGDRRRRRPGRLQALPAPPREVHLAQGAAHPRRPRRPTTDLWALRDVAFDVAGGRDGRASSGRNGSGKSTAAQVHLRRAPAHRRARSSCAARWPRCSSSVPGSSPTCRGRENIYLNGSMLGLSKKRDRQASSTTIVAFAELEQFIDNQVKFYSSGMYVRLGFAVAVNVDPDILVVDEVLAVGDERFQRKCVDRIKDVPGRGPDHPVRLPLARPGPRDLRPGGGAERRPHGRRRAAGRGGADLPRAACSRPATSWPLGSGSPPRRRSTTARELPDRLPTSIRVSGESAAETADRARPVRLSEVIPSRPAPRAALPAAPARPSWCGSPSGRPSRPTASSSRSRSATTRHVLFRTDTDILGHRLDLPAGPGADRFRFESFPLLRRCLRRRRSGSYRVGGDPLRLAGAGAVKVEVMNPGRPTALWPCRVGSRWCPASGSTTRSAPGVGRPGRGRGARPRGDEAAPDAPQRAPVRRRPATTGPTW